MGKAGAAKKPTLISLVAEQQEDHVEAQEPPPSIVTADPLHDSVLAQL